MDLKRELTDYEIGGIGDIKKHTLRFHSYRIGTMDGKLTIFAEYTPGQFPKVYRSHPSGQELLIELCNLNLELRNKPLEKCARILIRWSLENIHPYYFYGDDVAYLEMNNDDPNGFWDCMVNRLESYSRFCGRYGAGFGAALYRHHDSLRHPQSDGGKSSRCSENLRWCLCTGTAEPAPRVVSDRQRPPSPGAAAVCRENIEAEYGLGI